MRLRRLAEFTPTAVLRSRSFLLGLSYAVAAAAIAWHIHATVADPAMRWTMVDLQVYREASVAAPTGRNVYEGGFSGADLPYLYPPFALIALAPLSLVSLETAKVAMSALSVVALASIAALVVRTSRLDRRWRHPIAVLATGVLLVSEPMQQNLQMGQINVLIAAGILFDFLLPRRSRAKGILTGVLAGLKLTPALFAVYYALSGQWRAARNALIAFLGSIAVGVVLLPAMSWQFWTQEVWASQIGPNMLGNQSLRGTLGRLLPILGASSGTVTGLWLALALLGGCGATLVLARRGGQAAVTDPVAVYGGLAVVTLLVSPLSWTPHWISLAPLVIWLGLRWADPWRACGLLIAVGALLFVWPVDGVPSGLLWFVYPDGFWGSPDSPLWHAPVYFAVASSYTAIGIALLGSILWRTRGQNAALPQPSSRSAP